jgi:alkaline phosphatase
MWDNTDWHALADKELEEAIDAQNNIKNFKAKNVIMFLGDGMGISTIAAARLYNAENKNLKGSKMYLSWEKFPHVGLSRVS